MSARPWSPSSKGGNRQRGVSEESRQAKRAGPTSRLPKGPLRPGLLVCWGWAWPNITWAPEKSVDAWSLNPWASHLPPGVRHPPGGWQWGGSYSFQTEA